MIKKCLIIASCALAFIPALSSAQTAPLSPPPTCVDVSMNLHMAPATSPQTQLQVVYLQTDLVHEGYTINPNELGTFGPSTEAAVNAFQEKYASDVLAPFGLTQATGYVGPVTRLKLEALYGCRVQAATVPPGTNVSFAVTNLTLDSNGVNATVCNDGTTTLPTVPFRIRLNGINRDFEAVGSHAPGACTSDTWQYATWGLSYSPNTTFTVVTLLDPNGVY